MTTSTHSPRNWRAVGACLTSDPDLFFPISSAGPAVAQIAEAKAICANCEVSGECLAFARANPWVSGIWGGTTAEDRQLVRRRERRRARAAERRAAERRAAERRAAERRAAERRTAERAAAGLRRAAQ